MNYALKNGKIEVGFTTLGGTLTSIKNKEGLEFLWQGDATYWSGQAPILFPICGSIRNNKATVGEGLQMEMARHGIVRKREFELLSQSDDEISFVIQSNEEMLKQFPYDFKLVSRYTLKDNSVVISYEVENTGDKVMPFHVGAHPGFRCPLLPGEKYTDYYVEFDQEENLTIPKPMTDTGLIDVEARLPLEFENKCIPLSRELFDIDSVILEDPKSRKVTLKSKVNDHSVTVAFDDMKYLVLWSSANEGPFVAIEPWVGLSTCSDEDDVFEHKRNIQYVKPGEIKKYVHTISVQ